MHSDRKTPGLELIKVVSISDNVACEGLQRAQPFQRPAEKIVKKSPKQGENDREEKAVGRTKHRFQKGCDEEDGCIDLDRRGGMCLKATGVCVVHPRVSVGPGLRGLDLDGQLQLQMADCSRSDAHAACSNCDSVAATSIIMPFRGPI